MHAQPFEMLCHQVGLVLVQAAFDVVAVDAALAFLDQIGGGLDLGGGGDELGPAVLGHLPRIGLLLRCFMFCHDARFRD
mgnify:CR=1 FL=1